MNKHRPNYFNIPTGVQEVGRGLITRMFPFAFKVLLTHGYNEGTPQGLYFNTLNELGQSSIYVRQTAYEGILEKIVNDYGDSLKYLVGFTGIGKTTLLKNFFKAFSRSIEIRDGLLILYISFHSANLNTDNPKESVDEVITEYILTAVDKLIDTHPDIEKLINNHREEFNKALYDNICENKEIKIPHNHLLPSFSHSGEDKYTSILNEMVQSDLLAYCLFLLKFVVNMCNDIQKVVFIYDDIESQANIFHRHVADSANHIHSCTLTHKNRNYHVKTIISLKSFTFRENVSREAIARRVDIDNDVVLKETIPPIIEIFKKRFNVAKKQEYKRIENPDSQTWEEAEAILDIIARELSINFGDAICKLTNNDIHKALIAFVKILTNHRYVAASERENRGAFRLSRDDYNIKTSEPVFKALAYGEGDVFSDVDQHMFCNVLQVHDDENPGSELLGLYILNYLINSKKNGKNTLYGLNYEIGKDIVDRIVDVFITLNNIEKNELKKKLNLVMEHFYEGSIILRSIRDYEEPETAVSQTSRVYKEDYGVYLSLRGQKLYNLLSESSFLFEIYRDDIDTQLPNNQICSLQMSKFDVLKYLIEYIEVLFEIEKQYIQKASGRFNLYIERFGHHFLVSDLLEGIVRSTTRYFSYDFSTPEFCRLKIQISTLFENISKYSNSLFEQHAIDITISPNLLKAYTSIQKNHIV